MNTSTSVSVGAQNAIGSDLPSNAGGGYGGRRQARPQSAPVAAQAEALASKGHRLEISQDPATGAWIYTVTDRDTGEILMQREQDDVAKLGLTADYAAGALVKAKA